MPLALLLFVKRYDVRHLGDLFVEVARIYLGLEDSLIEFAQLQDSEFARKKLEEAVVVESGNFSKIIQSRFNDEVMVECQLREFIHGHPDKLLVLVCSKLADAHNREIGCSDNPCNLFLKVRFQPLHITRVVYAVNRTKRLELNHFQILHTGIVAYYTVCGLIESFIRIDDVSRKFHIVKFKVIAFEEQDSDIISVKSKNYAID